ncbi:hypothetical protein DSO57_1006872 [Entomophthora muscae]|uniref:Uncharacterized protein n=1 Tax=Entomophthora muscae TaxID=34485 RepID=A0ACC2T8C1_9FUNG|nr:hypothetical protein DSO57_1006872 [Entomophthora muscae]
MDLPNKQIIIYLRGVHMDVRPSWYSMNLISLSAFLFGGVNAGSAEDLNILYTEFANRYHDHACAAFNWYPISEYLINHKYYPDSWITDDKCGHVFCQYVFCISKSAHGEWLQRDSPGGFENWIYDAASFQRDGSRITVV